MSTLYPTIPELQAKLATARAEQVEANQAVDRYRETNLANYGDDPAIASGVRRKSSRSADSRRFAAYDREAEAWARKNAADDLVERLERQLARAERDVPVPYTDEQLRAAKAIRSRDGWHRVVKVNKTTVTVQAPPGWDNKVAIAKIVEVR